MARARTKAHDCLPHGDSKALGYTVTLVRGLWPGLLGSLRALRGAPIAQHSFGPNMHRRPTSSTRGAASWLGKEKHKRSWDTKAQR
jgi:hypothetical protein